MHDKETPMSKFLKTMAVISALALFISSFTACKKDDKIQLGNGINKYDIQ